MTANRERVLAELAEVAVPGGRNMVDADTGEIIAKANDELTDSLLKKLRAAGVKDIQCLFTNELDQGAYMSQTLAGDETDSELAARVAIYRMMRPGEPPTEDAVQALFGRLFYNDDTYDLSRVGRMKFNGGWMCVQQCLFLCLSVHMCACACVRH